MEAALPANEAARLEALYEYKILDTNPEEAFDDFTRLAAQICETPIALITLIDRDRQWCKSKNGLAIAQTAREFSFCAHAILQNEIFVVRDTLTDERFASNPLVTSSPYIRFYAGVPLITPQGYALGTLCVIDSVPRELKPQQLEALKALSRQVITQLELGRNLAKLEQATQESQQLEHQLSLRQQELLDFLESGTLGLHCLDPNGTILWANRAELDLLGCSHQEYVGQHIAKFYADREVIEDILRRLSVQEKLQNYEARLRCKNGSIRHVLIDSDARFINGKFDHTRCFTRDITEYKRTKEAMQQATTENLRLAEAIAAVSDGVLITDPNQLDNPIIYANPAFLKITGYSLDDIMGCNCRFLQGPGTDPQAIEQINKAIAESREVKATILNYRKDGQSFWNELKISPVFSDQGDLLYFVAIQTDITERKRAEEERLQLLQREQMARELAEAAHNRSQNILESITDAFFALDSEWRFTYLNPQAEPLLQKTRQQLLGKCVWDEFPQAIDSKFYQEYHRAVSEKIRVAFEEFYGPLKTWFSVHAYPSKEGLSVYFQDITERKQAEQKIQEQAALLDIATEAILVRDLDNKLLFWNKGAERLYGWEAAEALGKNANELLYKEISPKLLEALTTVIETGEWQGELRKVTQFGKEVIVESCWTLVRDQQGNPKSMLVVDSDITQKKQLEAQFLRTQRMESIGTLAGGIAHDLNNVLAPILMAVQLLSLKLHDERSRQWLEILEANAKRGADLVKQVVSFARGIEGDRTIVQVRHLITEIRQIAKETFPKFIEVHTDVPQNLWTVCADATQLHQVLMNLCVNARDAMPDGGLLSISAENVILDENYVRMHIDAQVGSYIVITVADAGMGIPQDIVDRIFEPFFTTKERGKGTGLGLSTVMGIIRSHKGFINVYSEVGQGTEFKVYLPALQQTQIASVEEFSLPIGHGELILVVDDEAAIRKITQTSLEAYKYRVLTASDGIEAIALYAQHKEEISVVLIDMMMPNMDGPTTIRTLQKIHSPVRIIAVSGLVSSDKLAQARCIGVKNVLSKPYTAKELLNAIDEVLNSVQ